MPKIVINEYDLSKAGTGEYANFSVVVPGFLGDNADESVFDENGIYEVSSQLDFVNNVGKRAANFATVSEQTAAVAPTVSAVIKYNADLVNETKYSKDAEGCETFEYREHDTFIRVFNSVLKGYMPTEDDIIPNTESTASSAYKVYYTTVNTFGTAGELKSDTHCYNAVRADGLGTVMLPDAEKAADSGELDLQAFLAPDFAEYSVIADDKIGTNGKRVEDRISHYGNQMAYELLGLGYTVLYKKMTEYTPAEIADKATEDDGLAIDEKTNTVITDEIGTQYLSATASAVSQINDGNFWECLKDKSTYDFRYLVTGLLTNNDLANKCILEIADHTEEILLDDASIQDGRGDCIALIDLDSKTYEGKTQTQAIPAMAKEAAEWASVYAAIFAPYVTYLMSDDPDYENNKTFPASFHYLACAANSANNNFSEWYANAGYTRGVSKYTIESTGCKLGEVAIQALEPRFMLKVDKELNATKDAYNDINTTVAINLIVKIKSGYYLWGNRTGKKLGTRGASDGDLRAQDFLNIRQLCTTIKKQVYVTCRRLTFDPNSNNLWINFRSLLTPMLEEMKADQGIKDYKFVKNDTDRKALLSAKIRIVPIEAVEDFEIGLYLEDTLDDVALTEA